MDGDDEEDVESFNSQIEIGEAVLGSARGETGKQLENSDVFQTPPVHKNQCQEDSLATPETPASTALESRKSLSEIQ